MKLSRSRLQRGLITRNSSPAWLFAPGVWADAGGVITASPSVGANVISNGNIESGNPPTGWSAVGSSTLSSVADERTGGSGSKALEAARGVVATSVTKNDTVTIYRWHCLSAWLKRGTATDIAVQLGDSGNWKKTTSTDWVQAFGLGYENDTTLNSQVFLAGSSGVTGRVDDYVAQPLTHAELFYVQDKGTPNQRVEANITLGDYAAGVVCCLDSRENPQNYIVALLTPYDNVIGNPPRVIVYKVVAGVRTALASPISVTYVAGAPLALQYDGGDVSVSYNHAQIGAVYTVADATFASNTLHGLFSPHSGSSFENPAFSNVVPFFTVTTAAADLWTTSGSNDWLGRPVLADVNGDNTLWAAIYRAATGHGTSDGGVIKIRFSDDQGATWTAENTFTDAEAVSGWPSFHSTNTNTGNPYLLVAPNGDLLLHVDEGPTQRGTWQHRSTDNGKTWTDEGRINSDATLSCAQDHVIVGNDIYIVFMHSTTGNGDYPWLPTAHKSSDNGTTWTELGTIEPSTSYGNECAIAHVGGNNFVAVMREGDGVATYFYRSSDACQTWSARQAVSTLGLVARPRLKALAGGIILIGRQELGIYDRTVVWFSPDDGERWEQQCYLDSIFTDTGYCDVLERDDGRFYMLTYGGTQATAAIRRLVFEAA